MVQRFERPGRRKRTGAHYTPEVLADFVADRLVEADRELGGARRILDPAVGNGQLLRSLIGRLPARGPQLELFGYDTDPQAIRAARHRLKDVPRRCSVTLRRQDFLELAEPAPDGLLDRFDLVIANPPYVRTQVLGSGSARNLAQKFGLTGRVDLYYAFVELISRVLRPGGLAGIIVSNRFMTVKAGTALRRHMAERFAIRAVWDFGDTRLFPAAVLPAVLLLQRRPTVESDRGAGFVSIYAVQSNEKATPCADAVAAVSGKSGLVRLPGNGCFEVRRGTLHRGDEAGDVWRLATPASERWLRRVEQRTHCTFGELGEIRVGVKSTADPVFVSADWDELPLRERPELLRPLTNHHAARRYRALEPQPAWRILYPHEVLDGTRRPVALADFPRTARYLRRHRDRLESRDYVSAAGRRWYELWVPHDPDAWARPKLVFRDIAERPTFWLDLTGSVVQGDCYWLSLEQGRQRLLWLALAVANSTFIERFYDLRFNNRLYAGRRRFMTQYVREFPLPCPDTPVAQRIIGRARRLHRDLGREAAQREATQREARLDALVWQAFGLDSA
ncbi:MAG: N-6 DNA methylase [bacterium]